MAASRNLRLLVALLAITATACKVGPNYRRPSAPAPPAFKEPPPPGWKTAQPSDGVIRGKWWEMFNDTTLNGLEDQVNLGNQNVAMAEAQYRQAQAAIRVARSALFPTISAAPSSGASSGSSRAGTAHFAPAGIVQNYNFPFDASWAPDIWGSARRNVAENVALAQSSSAVLQNVRLLYESQLAADYFQLRGIDTEAALLDQTLKSYREFLTLTQDRLQGGIATEADVAQAETQVHTTQSQLIDLGETRAALEHAIAILMGKPPADFSLAVANTTMDVPVIPVAMPSQLLERRPDIADAERQAAAANELIGIAKAAYYPNLTITAAGGFQSSSFLNWITWPSRFWTLGAQLPEILFDAGKRSAQVQEAVAQYNARVANYRQTVLTAFQEVEDNLSSLRVLQQEGVEVQQAIQSAQRTLDVSLAQYKAGTATYLQVITAQAATLGAQRSAVSLLSRRMTSAVLLIQALGGGWDASQMTH